MAETPPPMSSARNDVRDALTEYNGGPAGRHPHYYRMVMGAYVEILERSRELLDRVGLAGRGGERVRRYSKGMTQRLGLALAILHRPDLVLLDEPTSALDPVGRREVRELVRELAAAGVTVFLNSHLLTEVDWPSVGGISGGHGRAAGPAAHGLAAGAGPVSR